jgi:hypothetical protein
MTKDEIGLTGNECLANCDHRLASKVVGTREFEKWRVGNGIAET